MNTPTPSATHFVSPTWDATSVHLHSSIFSLASESYAERAILHCLVTRRPHLIDRRCEWNFLRSSALEYCLQERDYRKNFVLVSITMIALYSPLNDSFLQSLLIRHMQRTTRYCRGWVLLLLLLLLASYFFAAGAGGGFQRPLTQPLIPPLDDTAM